MVASLPSTSTGGSLLVPLRGAEATPYCMHIASMMLTTAEGLRDDPDLVPKDL